MVLCSYYAFIAFLFYIAFKQLGDMHELREPYTLNYAAEQAVYYALAAFCIVISCGFAFCAIL